METASLKPWLRFNRFVNCCNSGDEARQFSALTATAEMESGVLRLGVLAPGDGFQLRPIMSTERSSARAE
jgi:hypothetical protein